MLVRPATENDLASILAAAPDVDIAALRANHDLLGPTSDPAEHLRRLIHDEWHEVLIAEEHARFAGWLFLVYQRERSPFGDHLRVRLVQADGAARTALLEHAVTLAREKHLRKIDLDYDAIATDARLVARSGVTVTVRRART